MVKSRGFTLIELLVVIAVIAVLIAILMPALQRAKEQTRAVKCMSNLRQWGVVYSMHTADNKGRFDGYINSTIRFLWADTLRPYYTDDRLRFCPSASKLSRTPLAGFELGNTRTTWSVWGPRKGDEQTYQWGGYGMSIWVINPPPGRASFHGNPLDPQLLWRTPDIEGANAVPVLLDCAFHGSAPYHTDTPPVAEDTFSPLPRNTLGLFCMDRHDGGINGLFLDWSVRKVGLKELWELQWHRRWYEYSRKAGSFGPADYSPPKWPQWLGKYKDYAKTMEQ